MAAPWNIPNRPRKPLKETRSFSLDRDLLQLLEDTKGEESASERVNQLLRFALEAERYSRLENEAEQFYGSVNDTEETRAFQSAAIKSWVRE
jgi:hypothetical protein